MTGQTETKLKKRLEQVDGMINDAYAGMISSQDIPDEEKAEASYAMYAGRYDAFTKLLILITKNYDEAVSVDSRSPEAHKAKTTIQKLREKRK